MIAAIAVVVSIVSLWITVVAQTSTASQDRQATYNRDILWPAYTRFTTALDTFEQVEKADLARVQDSATENAGLNAGRYAVLLSEVRSAKAQVDLVAPASVSAIAASANNKFGTEQFCMARLISGMSGTNFPAEKQNRLTQLAKLKTLREHFVTVARSQVSVDSDPLKTTPSPSASSASPPPRAGDC